MKEETKHKTLEKCKKEISVIIGLTPEQQEVCNNIIKESKKATLDELEKQIDKEREKDCIDVYNDNRLCDKDGYCDHCHDFGIVKDKIDSMREKK